MGKPFIHESAYVDEGAQIGSDTKVWHFCHVLGGAIIGERCSLGQNVVVMNGVRIANNVKIQNNVSVYEGVELEDDVFCGPSMVFTNVVNPRAHVSGKMSTSGRWCDARATIGANATIVCGITLDEYAFNGAGSVVTGRPLYVLMSRRACSSRWLDLPVRRAVVRGNPRNAHPVCGTRYKLEGDRRLTRISA
jgi:UDP-2-acetamido-3-amino-2,3-dideoxy-glucuronate N-acetyltransferase